MWSRNFKPSPPSSVNRVALIATILLVLGSPFGSAHAEPYEWPLKTPRLITSSFGEYRTFRFHAGIDLRAAVGTPVYAADDGFVERIRVSPWGYGKAVYLRVADGNLIVYAHLDRFNEAIEATARRAQHARESYSIDIYPERGQLPIRRGELIAYTGMTGAGPPHLHYEIRDPGNVVINPRLLGIAWPDDTRPIVTGAAVVPRGPDSRINGDFVPLVMTPRHEGGGRYVCDPVTVSGAVGVAVAKHDPANEGANRLGIHTLEVQRNGETVFRMVNDRLSYDTMNHGAVAWHAYLLESGRFLTGFRQRGNESPPYRAWQGDGYFTIPPEGAEVVMILRDFLGNESTVRIPFVAALDMPPLDSAPLDVFLGNETPRVAMDIFGDWLTAALHFDAPPEAAPRVRLLQGRNVVVDALPVTSSARASYRVAVAGASLESGDYSLALARTDGSMHTLASFSVVQPGPGGRRVRVGDAEIATGSGWRGFGPMLIDTTPTPSAIGSAPVPGRGQRYPLGHPNTPLDEAITVRIPLPRDVENPSRAHIYRRSGSSWSWMQTTRTGDNLEAQTRRLGEFAVLEDNVPPVISDLAPAQGAPLSSRRPEIRANVSDPGSGIVDVRATLGETWLLFAYDPDADAVFWKRDRDLPSGSHTLRITVTDRAGNATTITRDLAIP